MKKIVTLLATLAACISLLSLAGCKKVWDYIKQHPGGIASDCSIERITFTTHDMNSSADGFFKDTLTIKYNDAGNPLEMAYAWSRQPGISEAFIWGHDCLFKYDNKNRLIVFLEGISPEYSDIPGYHSVLWWHQFTYVNANLIIDSSFEYTRGNYLINDRPDGAIGSSEFFQGLEITEYTLDNYGRIIKTSGRNSDDPQNPYITEYYSYDASGNLIRPGVTYSDKINIKQTNKVWMFLARDYSTNAPAGEASGYNTNKLPVRYPSGKNFFFDKVYSLPEQEDVRIVYHCR
ncbi:MAG: hypothetical protein QM763_14265 [Agriterribacter sp.]